MEITIKQRFCSIFERIKEKMTEIKNVKRLIIEILIVVCLLVGGFVLINQHLNSEFRVVYSLDKKQTDQEIIKMINDADKYVYFAIYFFTKENIAEALIRAKERGLIVEGITDAGASLDSNKEIVSSLKEAGISIGTQKHSEGIMHMKVIVTDKAYASGSYNWTGSATNINDEILEIGTNESVRKQYLKIIQRVFSDNEIDEANNFSSSDSNLEDKNISSEIPEYDYTEAVDHIGEQAIIRGKVVKVFASKSGTTFLDFCPDYKNCSFSAVIFSSDIKKFPDVSKYEREVEITGLIKAYNGKAEIILSDPKQIK